MALYLTRYYSDLFNIEPNFRYYYITDMGVYDEVTECIKVIEKDLNIKVDCFYNDNDNYWQKY